MSRSTPWRTTAGRTSHIKVARDDRRNDRGKGQQEEKFHHPLSEPWIKLATALLMFSMQEGNSDNQEKAPNQGRPKIHRTETQQILEGSPRTYRKKFQDGASRNWKSGYLFL